MAAKQDHLTMIKVTEEILGQMAEAIVREVHPARVYLFGSRAKGCARDDSDVDLLVVEDQPFGPGRSRLQELQRIRGALSSYFIPKDVLVFSADEFAHWGTSPNHIVSECVRDGRVLYARP